MRIIRNSLVVPIPNDPQDELLYQLQKDVLEFVYEKGVKGVILDLSELKIIDSILIKIILDTAKMASLMGASPMFVGLRPELVGSLIHFDFDPGCTPTVSSIEEACQMLHPELSFEEVEEGIEEEEKEEEKEEEEMEESDKKA
ncbi:MAG: STAS domain-containing protein [Acidobacteriota bacterium]|nr:STAS domain-containing protein [Acidobacteriota bacterium]